VKDLFVSNSKETGSTLGSSLLEQAQFGDTSAFDRITQLYKGLVYVWCRSKGLSPEDSEDLVQQVFLTVFKSIKSFSKLKPEDSFRKWLRAIAHNKIVDHFRKNKFREKAFGGEENLEIAISCTLEDADDQASLKKEDAILYEEALKMMQSTFSPRDCRAFILIHVDGMTPRDAAQALGMSVNSVYIAKSRIKKRLREEFADLIDQ
jgi:RNA polymerase sigma-70 factor, ECF subfamily